MVTNKELNKIRLDLAVIGSGAKKELAEYLEINPSNITRYLKYGEIPKKRLTGIYKFIKSKKQHG